MFTVVNNTGDKLVSTTSKKTFSADIVNTGIYTLVWAFILIASVVSLMPGDKLNRIILKSSKYIYHAIKSYVLMLVNDKN